MDRLLTQTDAAEVLLLSPRTLERMRVSGTGPSYVKLGRRVAYREVDLEAWIALRIRTNTSYCEE
jgi:predicted DNA-binding transcriptional regulator AlpA